MAKRLKKPLLDFKIYPSSRSTLYFNVKIFEFMKDMYAYARRKGCTVPNIYNGMCISHTRFNKEGRKTIDCGEILLSEKKCSPGTVAHECQHAAFAYMDRKGIKIPNRSDAPVEGDYWTHPEEVMAWAVGNMTEQIYYQLAQAKEAMFA